MAIFLIYGTDVDVLSVLTKGNFDQMIREVENLSKLSKVYVYTKDSHPYSDLFKEKAEHLSSKLFSLPDTTTGKLLRSAIFSIVGFISIVRRLREIEVVVSQGTTVLQGAVASSLFHKPHIMFLHYFAYDEQYLLKRKILSLFFRTIELFTLRHSTYVIVPNERLKTEALARGAKSVQIIPNFVDMEEIAKMDDRKVLRAKFRFVKGLKVILFVGRLHPVKNVDLLLRSFRCMDQFNKSILVIVGDGPEKQNLVDLANSLGISNRVFFEGFKTKRTVLEYMKASDMLVLPSLVEGQPRVVLEAWACGLPIVASRAPGLKNLINDRMDGLLFDPHSEEQLAETISLALDSEIANSIRINAKKQIVKYDANNVFSQQRKVIMKFILRTAHID